MTHKHTPAPWHVEEPLNSYNASSKTHIIGDELVIASISYGMATQNRANARLIAAAPELLEALEQVVSSVNKETGEFLVTYETLNTCLKAINKAKGTE